MYLCWTLIEFSFFFFFVVGCGGVGREAYARGKSDTSRDRSLDSQVRYCFITDLNTVLQLIKYC